MILGRYLPPSVKLILRNRRHQLRSALIRGLFSFTPDDFLHALRSIGICPGDTIMVHSSYASFEGFSGGVSDVIRKLQAAVGEEGTLLQPTMPFTGRAIDYVRSGHVTDIRKTPSKMGLLTEVFRRRPDVVRSIHPTHPIAAWGCEAAAITADHYKCLTPCGAGSPFHRLLLANGKTLLAGVGIESMTFFHYIEEHLERAMPFSPFTSEWFDLKVRGADGVMRDTHTRLFDPSVSPRRNLLPLRAHLNKTGSWKECRVGRLRLAVIPAAAALSAAESMAASNEFCYR
jgi:aminoglycoside 3-N-acetyltransferase